MESTVIQHMVDNILLGKNAEAMENFGDAISAKVSDVLDAKRIEIASTLGQTENEE